MINEIGMLFNLPHFVEVLENHKKSERYIPLGFVAYLLLNSPTRIVGGGGCLEKNIGINLLEDRKRWNIVMYEPPERMLYTAKEFKEYILGGKVITTENFMDWLQERLSYFEKVSVEKLSEKFILRPYQERY